ncbi:MAG: DUF1801 domain-containing protein [Acidobacteria bacterium]|nr:DUF1801 domain-containing protein [Acidobacteriota bacterium]
MAELKTKETRASVKAFLDRIENPQVREDCYAIAALMESVTKEKPKMWGTAIVGFGSYHYVYASGQEGDWPTTAFSPRKQAITVYIMPGFEGHKDLMSTLGTYSTGKSCLYFKRLSDIHVPTLKKLIKQSLVELKKVIQARKAAARKA